VDLLVGQQFIPARKRVRTAATLKSLHLAVGTRVPHHLYCRLERSRALLAHERLDAAVDAHVLGQIGVSREALGAHVAGIWPHARMDNCVLLEIGATHESLPADLQLVACNMF